MLLKPVTLNKMLFINKWWGRSSNIKNAVMVADGIGYTHTHIYTYTHHIYLYRDIYIIRKQSSQQKQQTNANNQQTQQRYDYDHNGVYRTPAEQKAHEQWIKDQVEWKKQNETRKQKLQDEYFNLSDKMYEDGVSKAEYNSMEKRQDEILDEVRPIN